MFKEKVKEMWIKLTEIIDMQVVVGRNDPERYVSHTFATSSFATGELIHFSQLLNWASP